MPLQQKNDSLTSFPAPASESNTRYDPLSTWHEKTEATLTTKGDSFWGQKHQECLEITSGLNFITNTETISSVLEGNLEVSTRNIRRKSHFNIKRDARKTTWNNTHWKCLIFKSSVCQNVLWCYFNDLGSQLVGQDLEVGRGVIFTGSWMCLQKADEMLVLFCLTFSTM